MLIHWKMIHMNRIYHICEAFAKWFQSLQQIEVSSRCQMTPFKVILGLYTSCWLVQKVICFSSPTFKVAEKQQVWIISLLEKLIFSIFSIYFAGFFAGFLINIFFRKKIPFCIWDFKDFAKYQFLRIVVLNHW